MARIVRRDWRLRARYREIAAVAWDERLLKLVRGSGLERHLSERAPAASFVRG